MAVRVRELYARALLEASASDAEKQALWEDMHALGAVFEETPAYLRLMVSPSLEKAKRRELLTEAFGGKVHPKLMNLLKVLADNGRFADFPSIFEEYTKLLDEDKGILAVTAVTAMPLSPEMERRLREKLSAQTGKEIRLTVEVEPSVLGGVLLRYGGKEIDGTVRARLEGIRRAVTSAAIN